VALLLALFATPAVALGGEDDEEGASTLFSLRASHGYRMYVFADADRDDGRGEVLLYLVKGRTTAATYRTEGTVTDTSIEADFGALGRVELELRHSGKQGKTRAHAPCNGEVEEFEKATFRGTLEFRGEAGFTRARATRIPVSLQAWIDLVCSNHFEVETEDLEPGVTGASLQARLRLLNRGGVGLELTKSRPDGRTLVTASMAEKRHGIFITRAVQRLVGADAFSYDSTLSTASVDLPAPFSGTATFSRDAGPGEHWLGNLRVDLPGRANVPLVRPDLRPTLVPAAWSVEPPEFR